MSDGLRVDQIKKKPYGDFNIGAMKSKIKNFAASGQVHFDVKNLPNLLNGSSKAADASFSG